MRRHICSAIMIVLLSSCINETFETISKDNKATYLSLTKSTSCQTYYWYGGNKIYLSPVDDKHFVIIDSRGMEETVYSSVSNLTINDFYPYPFDVNGINHTSESSYMCGILSDITNSVYTNDIIYSAPFYITEDGSEIGISNLFSVKLKNQTDLDVLESFAENNNLSIVENDYIPLWHILSCTELSSGNALEMANIAYESGLFANVSIDFLNAYTIEESSSYNDPEFSNQWNLSDTYGINIESVHSITKGSSSVKVAVIDTGFQIDHPDLNINTSWDATSQTSPALQYTYAYPNESWGRHGTCMAGIIGAQVNNNEGIVGIAPNVTLIPISVKFGVTNDHTLKVGTSFDLARAVYHAAMSADIISNSWTGSVLISDMEDAINSAITSGRDGKGCIIVQSSGNDTSNVSKFPYKAFPEILCVGNLKSNGQRYYSSVYGEHLDIMAPGTSIRTTTLSGEYTYSTGTSPACPHVAATAALMLSVNPDLTHQEVSDIIESTARKWPSYTFTTTSGRPNGLWNDEVGYGLVNCYDAVNLAYHYNANNYFNLIEFDYSGSQIEIDLKTKDNIAVIWDWETKDISYINATASSPTDTTITHNYGTTGSRRVIIAETIAPGETAPTSSTSLTRFELTTGNNASNIDIKAINSALEYIRIIGGANFASQSVTIDGLSSLKELYLVQLKNASISVKNCGSLTTFGTSRQIWRHREFGSLTPIDIGTVDPNVVGGGTTSPDEWPNVPETQMSPISLSISNCPYISTLSLENAGFMNLSFSGMNYLSYVYLSSQLGKIVGAGSNSFMPTTYGYFLSSAISTLPTRDDMSKGKIVIRAVNTSNTDYIPVSIGNGHKTNIQTKCNDKKWILVWDSGIN